MRKLFVICITCLTSLAYGQEAINDKSSEKFRFKNSIQIDVFGHGCFYSINFERILLNSNKFKTSGQIGVSYYPETSGVIPLWIPISVNELISFNSHHIEFGLGQVIINDRLPDGTNDYKLFGSFKIGYRFQKPDSKYLMKIAFTPIIDYWDKFDSNFNGPKVEFIPWGGLTFGYNF